MNFGLEDMMNNTILGTPVKELSALAAELEKNLQACIENPEKCAEQKNT